jgi:endonuclease YncB( thermonuclease family)
MIYLAFTLLVICLFIYCIYLRSPYEVIKHCDGDTSYLRHIFGREIKIRYAVIDANETKQAGGKEATQYLNKLLPIGSRVAIKVTGKASYDRDCVCIVYCNMRDINLAILKAGHAVIDPRYMATIPPSMQAKYIKAQSKAKARKIGRWSNPKWYAQNPWEFRSNKKWH